MPVSAAASLAAVLSELPAIGKNRNAPGSMGGYAFRSIEDITAALKPLLAKHGLTVVPTIIDRRDSERSIGNNRIMFVTDLLIRFTFVADDGSTVEASMWGQGTDMGDKAPQKAVTAAFKSMLSVALCISDAESDAEQYDVPVMERPRPAAKSRIDPIREAVKAAGLAEWARDNFDWPWTDTACDAIEYKLVESGSDVPPDVRRGPADAPSTSGGPAHLSPRTAS